MRGEIVTLAENASATGSEKQWEGGRGVFVAEATWSGGTAALEFKTKNGTWVPLNHGGAAVELSANGAMEFDAPRGPIRVAIATATAVYAYAHAV